MGTKELLGTAANQKLQKCIVSNKLCRFHFRYGRFEFCVSELSGKSCEVERLDDHDEGFHKDYEKVSGQLLFEKPE